MLLECMCPWNLTNRSVFPSEVAHNKVNRDSGWCHLHDQFLGRDIKVTVVVSVELNAESFGLGDACLGKMLWIPAIGVQVLILNRTGETQIAARPPDAVI